MSFVTRRHTWRARLLWSWLLLPIALATLALATVRARESALPNDVAPAADGGGTTLLARAHAHNDYEHRRPLYDALSRGFASIEADVWMLRGKLLVAHNFWNISPSRTLDSLYLGPLERRVTLNHGRVYPDSPASVQLLIDVKTDAEESYAALQRQLARHARMLTKFDHGRVVPGAVTAIISGNCPRALLASQSVRYAACDGRLEDLGAAARASLVPLISERWSSLFDWDGDGPMPRAERAKLRSIAQRAHAHGQQVRFWSTPDEDDARVAVWSELLAAGVDYINTDALDALRKFLLAREQH